MVVPKTDGTLRLCIDFKRLNALATFGTFSMPPIEEMLEQIGQAQYITTLDLSKGYWQIPMASEDLAKMAFRTH